MPIIILITLIFWHNPLRAQQDERNKSNVFTLGEIEVKDATENNKNITIEKIDKKELEDFNRNRFTDALSLLPGVTVTGGGRSNDAGVYVRGFSPARVPVFLDGIPIYVPYDRTVDYSRFTTFDLSEIVVSKGFTSVLYGSNTMGGAINMVSLKPLKPFDGSVGAEYGTGNTYFGYANVGTNQRKWYLQGGSSYYNRNYCRMSETFVPTSREGGTKREQSWSEDSKMNFKIGFTPAPGHEYAFGHINQHGSKGSPPDVRPTGDNKYWLWPRWDKETSYITTNTPLGSKSYFKLRLYYDKFYNMLDMFTDQYYSRYDTSFGQRSYYDDWTVGGAMETGTTLIPRNSLKAAFHYKRDTHNERNRMTTAGAEPWHRSDDLIMSVGVEDTIDITKNLYAITGISYDEVRGHQAQEWTSSVSGRWFNYETATVHAWNPQLGFFCVLSDTGKVHATVEKKTKIPTMKEKFSGGFGTRVANPDLKPEKSVNYEIGYQDVFLKKILFKTAVFYNDIDNAIISYRFTSGPNNGRTQNQNIGKVTHLGIEIGATASVTDDLEVGLNYTYLDRTNKTPHSAGPSALYKMAGVPEHKLFSYIKYATPITGLNLRGDLEYNPNRWNSESNDTEIVGTYTLVNFKASYATKKVSGLLIEAGINNVFDRNYAYTLGYPEPGRSYFVGMRHSF